MNTLISRFGPRFDNSDIRFDPRLDQNDIRFDPQFIESELKKEYLGKLFKKIEEEKLQKRKEEINLARQKAALTRFVNQNHQNWSDDGDIDFSLILIFDDNMDLSD